MLTDLRYALRNLARSPGFTFVGVASLALGIGANSAIFSLVRATFFPTLPYQAPSQLVDLHETSRDLCVDCRVGVSYPTYLDWKAASRSFAGMGASLDREFVVAGESDALRVSGSLVSWDLFPTLGVRPVLGRGFTADDDRLGAPRVVMLSHGLWEQMFGSDSTVIGREVRVNGTTAVVVGVMPPRFGFPQYARMWAPIVPNVPTMARDSRSVGVVARIAADATLERAQGEIAAIGASIAREHPAEYRGWTATATPIIAALRADSTPFLVLLGASAFVLLIACANLANLMLVRGARRERELAVRSALGAGRSRLVRLLLAESLSVAFAGGFLGLLIAMWGVDLVPRLLALDIPFWITFEVDWRVVAFAISVSILTALAFGLLPALRVTRPDLVRTLKEGGQTPGSGRRGRLRSTLVVAQISFALVLLAGAGLMVKTFLRSRDLSTLGWDPRNLLMADVQVLQPQYDDSAQVGALASEIEARVASIPGVSSTSVEYGWFLGTFVGAFGNVTLEGAAEAVPDAIVPRFAKAVGPDYFEVMRIPVNRGRGFERTDRAGAPGAVVIDEAAAAALWPGTDAIGKRLKLGQPNDNRPWLTVVGVAASTMGGTTQRRPTGFVYVPFSQQPSRPFTVIARTSGPPLTVADAFRNEIRAADRDAAVDAVSTMEATLRRGISGVRFMVSLLGGLAALALALSALGIYGVVSYAIAQRTREIGIRMALGATAPRILRLVVGYGAAMTAIGLAIGSIGAFALTGLLRGILFGTSATDPTVFAAVAVVLATVAIGASYIPARRAVRIEPVVALRNE